MMLSSYYSFCLGFLSKIAGCNTEGCSRCLYLCQGEYELLNCINHDRGGGGGVVAIVLTSLKGGGIQRFRIRRETAQFPRRLNYMRTKKKKWREKCARKGMEKMS